ncbi:MAG: hypothetical protein E6J87_24305 [Deltaproteobacteria bacterium]|nr:MAG: hypothetical protein E6J87_24305 [Deltaproteobacteria bacterium]
MRQTTSPSAFSRIAAALLIAGLLAPATGLAAEQSTDDQPAPAPVEPHGYDAVLHSADVTVDLLVVRPLAAVTFLAGAALFLPAAVMTSPNGTDSIHDAYERFIREPGEYAYSRPLGEF